MVPNDTFLFAHIRCLYLKYKFYFLINFSTYFSLLLSLGLIVALYFVSNRTPAAHLVKTHVTQKHSRKLGENT